MGLTGSVLSHRVAVCTKVSILFHYLRKYLPFLRCFVCFLEELASTETTLSPYKKKTDIISMPDRAKLVA